MKKTIAIILTLLLALSVFAACGKNTEPTEPADPTNAVTEVPTDDAEAPDDIEEPTDDNTEAPADDSAKIDLSAYDFSKADLAIADYAAMEKFLGEMDAGTWDQKIIKITGVEFYGMSHSVQIRNAADDGGIGVKYELVGEGEYPEEDGTAMTVTGVLVVDDSGWSRILYVPADQLILN